MARRSVNWNRGLSEDLKDIRFTQRFVQSALIEGLPVQAVLAKVIRAYGVKEFSSKVRMPSSNVLRAINPKHNPTIETLNRLLKPLALEITVVPRRKKRAA